MRIRVHEAKSNYMLYYVYYKTREDKMVFYGAEWHDCYNKLTVLKATFIDTNEREFFHRVFEVCELATDLNELRAEREPYYFGEHTLKYNKIIKILEDEINDI